MPGMRPQVGEVVRLRVILQSDEQIAMNTTHWKVRTITGTGVSLAELALYFDNSVGAVYTQVMSPFAQYRGCGVQNLALPITREVTDVSSAGPGIAGTTQCPRQCTYLLSWQTERGGPQGKGRIYPPFPPTSFIDGNGNLTAGGDVALLGLKTAYDITHAIAGTGTSTVLDLVIWNRADRTTIPVIETYYSDQIATQRRRGYYGKANNLPAGF